MPNQLIPRNTVHDWSEAIGANPQDHQAALTRLLRGQRRLTRWIQSNREHLGPQTGGVILYLTGVVVRIFDLAGGRLKGATWADIREAESRIGERLGGLLPYDDAFVERFRASERSQAHVLDEAYMALFQRPKGDEEEELDTAESLKTLMLMWVVTEVLDKNWKPPKTFEGEDEYTYVHIEPEQPEDEDEDDAL